MFGIDLEFAVGGSLLNKGGVILTPCWRVHYKKHRLLLSTNYRLPVDRTWIAQMHTNGAIGFILS